MDFSRFTIQTQEVGSIRLGLGAKQTLTAVLHKGMVSLRPKKIVFWENDEGDTFSYSSPSQSATGLFIANNVSEKNPEVGEQWEVQIVSQRRLAKEDKRGNPILLYEVTLIQRIEYETAKEFDEASQTWKWKVYSGTRAIEEKSVPGLCQRVRYQINNHGDTQEFDELFIEAELDGEPYDEFVCRKPIPYTVHNYRLEFERLRRTMGRLAKNMTSVWQVPTFPPVPSDCRP